MLFNINFKAITVITTNYVSSKNQLNVQLIGIIAEQLLSQNMFRACFNLGVIPSLFAAVIESLMMFSRSICSGFVYSLIYLYANFPNSDVFICWH